MATGFVPKLNVRALLRPGASSFGRTASRVISAFTAVVIIGTLLLYPRVLGQQVGPTEHLALLLILIGVCGAIMHSVGFCPDLRIVRLLLGPVIAWILIACGLMVLALPRLFWV
jgi:predicted membrane protein